jgi:hypothetical protein
MIILTLIGCFAVGLWAKHNVTITGTTNKELTPTGWKVDPVFHGFHILVNTTEIVAAYNWCVGLFKPKKEDKV